MFIMEFETLHLTALALTVLVIFYADHEGFQYFRGKKPLLSKKSVTWAHRLVWTGLILMILSGIGLVLPQWEYTLQEPSFYVKMGFVLVLVMNSFVIGKLAHVAVDRRFDELSSDIQKTLIVSGVLSGVGWVGAAIIGFFFL
jgi:hypothetical protein